MAFWKRNEDPWDMDPKKRPQPTVTEKAEKEQSPLDALKQWNEERKAEKARKLAESAPEPLSCPWCGKLMEARYLWGGQGVYLGEKQPGFFTSGLSSDVWHICDEGSILTGLYKTVWYCRDCHRLAADVKEPEETSTFAAEAPDQGGNEE